MSFIVVLYICTIYLYMIIRQFVFDTDNYLLIKYLKYLQKELAAKNKK